MRELHFLSISRWSRPCGVCIWWKQGGSDIFGHRENIASAASTLFMERGIAATSMDDIAKAAGYSKARYNLICKGLVRYQEEFRFYFKMVLDKINVDFENCDCLSEEKETYQVGEEINEKIKDFPYCTARSQWKEEILNERILEKNCGVYVGEYDVNFIYAKVEMTVQSGEMTNITLLEHKQERGKATEAIVGDMISEQKIDVDAVYEVIKYKRLLNQNKYKRATAYPAKRQC